MNIIKKIALGLAVAAIACALSISAAYADTDGTEIQITEQPDRFLLQLGAQWSGAEFELRTDIGVFPAPVIADRNGTLKMDLGGSKSYTLILQAVGTAESDMAEVLENKPSLSEAPGDTITITSAMEAKQEEIRVPIWPLVLFLTGLTGSIGALAVMRYFKRRKRIIEYEDE